MDRREASLPSTSVMECCTFRCTCALETRETWMRSVKRKYDEFEKEAEFRVPGLDISHVARVGIENERDALREMVRDQQRVIEELSLELDEERNASETAANEAMSMISKLQGEKAEVQMEARQFKCFSEEKMAHDAEEISVLEDLLYKTEQAIQSLTFEVQAYKHKMMSFGLTESEVEGLHGDDYQNRSLSESGVQVGSPTYIYPPIRCNFNELQVIEDHKNVVDIEEDTLVETLRGQYHLKDLEKRIDHLERTLHVNDALEMTTAHSPLCSQNPKRFSTENSFGYGPDYPLDSIEEEYKPSGASVLEDDTSDRVYTIDPINHGASYDNVKESEVLRPPQKIKESKVPETCEDTDVRKLYLRLQALEADRESLKQTIVSMQSDNAQLVLLREIAHQLYKDMSMERRMLVKKQSVAENSFYMTAFKRLGSILLWRKKARQSKHMFGMSANNAGLLGAVGPRTRHWRCVTSTQV